jgi:hypothetical protein
MKTNVKLLAAGLLVLWMTLATIITPPLVTKATGMSPQTISNVMQTAKVIIKWIPFPPFFPYPLPPIPYPVVS